MSVRSITNDALFSAREEGALFGDDDDAPQMKNNR